MGRPLYIPLDSEKARELIPNLDRLYEQFVQESSVLAKEASRFPPIDYEVMDGSIKGEYFLGFGHQVDGLSVWVRRNLETRYQESDEVNSFSKSGTGDHWI